jgi:hypothetical protein
MSTIDFVSIKTIIVQRKRRTKKVYSINNTKGNYRALCIKLPEISLSSIRSPLLLILELLKRNIGSFKRMFFSFLGFRRKVPLNISVHA